MRRLECLETLATLVDGTMLTVMSVSGRTSAPWTRLNKAAAFFPNLNLGLCTPFALGVALAFPQRRVIALETDGSLLLDTSSLVTVADAGPRNLLVLVHDNEAYNWMGSTATSRCADLAKIAQGAGIRSTNTVRTIDEYRSAVATALAGDGPHVLVAKIQGPSDDATERVPGEQTPARSQGRSGKDLFVLAAQALPDYWPRRQAQPNSSV